MDRGVIVGGGLIAASFLVAILLNRSAREEAAALPEPVPEPPAQVCDDPAQRPPAVGIAPDAPAADCKPSRIKSPQGTSPKQ